MFTPGFRLFFGFSMAALVAAIVYGFFSGDKSGSDALGVIERDLFNGLFTLGWSGRVGESLGYIVFVSLAGVAGFLGITFVAFRDADVESVAELSETGEIPSPQAPTQPNYWPAAAALGVGVFIVGLGTSRALWVLGLAILAIVAIEWMLSAWADRATGDPETNSALRRDLFGPFELPVVALAGVGIMALAISRILLAVSAFNAVWIAGVVATLILIVASIFAARPSIAKPVIAGAVALGAVAIIAGGIVSAAIGQRDFHHGGHGGHSESEDHSDDGHSEDGDHGDEGHSEDGEALGAAAE